MVKAAWEHHRIADTSERSAYRDSPVRRAGHQLQHQRPVMERTGLGGGDCKRLQGVAGHFALPCLELNCARGSFHLRTELDLN